MSYAHDPASRRLPRSSSMMRPVIRLLVVVEDVKISEIPKYLSPS